MHVQEQQSGDAQRVADLVNEIRFAMLTTEEEDGSLRSRPMSTMEMDADGNLWFFSALSSSKITEAQQHRQVCVSYMRPDKQDYLSISGSAQVVRDKDRMRRLWSPWIQPWFPQGLDDPDLVLLKITVAEAEYWDAPGSAIKRMVSLAKGVVSGDTSGLGEHGRLSM